MTNGKNAASFSEKKLKTVTNLIEALWPDSALNFVKINGNGKDHKSFSEKKLFAVSRLIKAIWPNSVFALCLWDRPARDAPCEVLYVSNCEEDEQASLLQDAATKLKQNHNLHEVGHIGHACIAGALMPLLLLVWFALQAENLQICHRKINHLSQTEEVVVFSPRS